MGGIFRFVPGHPIVQSVDVLDKRVCACTSSNEHQDLRSLVLDVKPQPSILSRGCDEDSVQIFDVYPSFKKKVAGPLFPS